jgi:hypothetical protein
MTIGGAKTGEKPVLISLHIWVKKLNIFDTVLLVI